MASSSVSVKQIGYCLVTLEVLDKKYKGTQLTVLKNLFTDIILGTDFQEQHDSITINYGGSKPPLTFSALTTLKTI